MKRKEIKNYKEFLEIAEKQGAEMLCTGKEVNREEKKLKDKNLDYTVFSIQDDNDGTSAYIVEGFRICNNLNYYVLQGKYSIEDYIEL